MLMKSLSWLVSQHMIQKTTSWIKGKVLLINYRTLRGIRSLQHFRIISNICVRNPPTPPMSTGCKNFASWLPLIPFILGSRILNSERGTHTYHPHSTNSQTQHPPSTTPPPPPTQHHWPIPTTLTRPHLHEPHLPPTHPTQLPYNYATPPPPLLSTPSHQHHLPTRDVNVYNLSDHAPKHPGSAAGAQPLQFLIA